MKAKVFVNYISHIPTRVYETLCGNGIIYGVKFPGTGASTEENESLIKTVELLKCNVDNHGWNGITGQLHDPHFADHISDFANLEKYLNLPGAWNFSSHIGASSKKLPSTVTYQKDFDEILLGNLSKIRETIFHFTGKNPTICGEGIFPFYFDPRTTVPSFINHTLKVSGFENGLDGLVLDLCHSRIAAKFMEVNTLKSDYSFSDYVNDLNRKAIKIIHVSGCGRQKDLLSRESIEFLDNENLDPHVNSTIDELNTLREVLKLCPNVEKISNEITYHKDYGIKLTTFDYVREALLTWCSVNSNIPLEKAESIISSELTFECSNANIEKVFTSLKEC